jgi:chromosome segregation ATPase
MSLKGIVQKTLQHSNPMTIARVKSRTASSVYDEMEELEKTVVDSIGRLKAALKEGEALVASEGQHAEQMIENLKANIGVLEAKVRETEDTVQRKDSASQIMERTLTAKIQDLQNEMKKKDESLDSRGNEIKDLKSKTDAQAKQVTQLEQAIQHAKAETASEAKRAEQISAHSNAKITTLEGQLKETGEIVREKDSTIKGLEQNHTAKIQDLESQLRTKEKDLADQNKEINDLKSEVQVLTKGIKEMSSFFKQAEALANIHTEDILAKNTGTVDAAKQLKTAEEKPVASQSTAPTVTSKATAAQNISTVGADKQLKTAEEKPAAFQPTGPSVTSNTTDTAREAVPASFFDSMTRELSEVFGPVASVIVRDHVKAVGESMEKFPKTRLAELVDNVSKEIPDDKAKISFRERLGKLYIVGKTVSASSTIE